jgi:hypothetical protein
MRTFAWQGFEFQHPKNWECVRFSKNRARGECALADPAGRRMSVYWSAVRGAVDAQRILQTAIQHLEKSDPKGKVTTRDWKAPECWSGFRWSGTENLTVALNYFADTGYLLQTQFFSGKHPDDALERCVLGTFHYQKTGTDWQWNAFGCRVTLPSTFAIEECEVLPGRASLTFKSPGRKGQKLRIDRMAVPESHLKGRPFRNWFCSTLDDATRLVCCTDKQIHGHKSLHADLKPRRPTPLQFITLLKRKARAAVWVCEHESRLYRAEWEGPAGTAPDFEQVLECCHG